MHRLFLHRTKLIFVGVAALLAWAHHSFLFGNAWHEDGDFAVNALQIERAGRLQELHGNYSRFHFHHPGPAFFYVYAAGERFFHRWLEITPSAHNAHALTGLLMQAGFFAWALGIAAGWVRAGWFVPVALLAAAVHFRAAENAFLSIWPPHVLLMPFLCFLVAGASTAAGRVAHLPLTVLCACFLVHGHVAQPLFVGVLSGLMLAAFAWNTRRAGGSWVRELARHRVAGVTSIAVLGLFLLPLVLDALAGPAGNLWKILEFVRSSRGEGKSLLQAASYLLSFFGYFHQQDHYLPAQGPGEPGFIWTRALAYALWAAAIGFVVHSLRRRDAPARASGSHPFLQSLAVLAAAAAVLALVWGLTQVGPMFEFNGHFFHALVYALILLVVAGVVERLPERGARVGGAVCCLAGAVVLAHDPRLPISADNASPDWVDATRAALAADQGAPPVKLLVFPHDLWGDVAKTALAVTRAGGDFRVDAGWSFMFGEAQTFHPASSQLDLRGLSVWRFSRASLPFRHVSLAPDVHLYLEPLPLDPFPGVIDCRKEGNLGQFHLFGLTTPDDEFSWSSLPRAALLFRAPLVSADVTVEILAKPFVLPPRLSSQPMRLFVNGAAVAAFDLAETGTVSARIPAQVWNRSRDVLVVLEFPAADSLRRLGISPDPRVLGWGIYRIAFGHAPGTLPAP